MNQEGGITYFRLFIRNIPVGETIIISMNIFNHDQHALYEQLYYVNKTVRKMYWIYIINYKII
jgi:glutamate formiminotransferase